MGHIRTKFKGTVFFCSLLLIVTLSALNVGKIQAQSQKHDLSETESFIGYAYSLNDSTLLYSEHHSIITDINDNRLFSHVQYKSSDGKVIADKSLKYDEKGYFPSFNFVDLRTKQSLNVEMDQTLIKITQGQGDKGLFETDTLQAVSSGTMIADAGFDVFMMKNWQGLVAGESKQVEFLAPTRNMFVTFKIEREFIRESIVGFSLAPDNFFISLLVDPIFLEYDINSGRIISYKGLTNIDKVVDGRSSGENVLAHIRYEYQD